MTPLPLVCLFFWTSAGSADAAVKVSIRLTEEASKQSQVQAKLNASEALINKLLGAQRKKARVPQGKDSFVQEYSAGQWSPTLPKEDFAQLVVTLKRLWEDKIDFAESQEGVPPGTSGEAKKDVPRLQLAGVQKAMERGMSGGLVIGRFDAFYDGSLVAANLNRTPIEAVPFKKPGLTTEAPGIVFTTENKDKPPEPPPLGSGHPYDVVIQEEAKAAGMDPAVLRAVVEAKGGFDSKPTRKSGGAHGVMLITKATAAGVGMKDADLNDARANIRVGARLLAELLQQFRGDVHRALAAYQVGSRAVIRSGGIPNDPEVQYFLAAYERALRGKTPKPEVKPVIPPKAPNARRVREEAAENIREKVEEIIPPSGVIRPRDPVSKYRKTIHLKAKKHGVDPWLVEAVMRAENPWGDPMRESEAGAIGLMQLMPETAKILRVNPRDPVQCIDGGVRHLKWLLELYNGNRVLAVAAYNAGDGAVGQRIPNYPETKAFVPKVFSYYEDLTGEKVDHVPFMPIAKRKTPTRKGSLRNK
ncbi:MAG: transglycosylase SLT domain-containing protein [Elusimicrobia bacterium]|nr:transglycosylase SLT domain-containing protein [Elusimicrobiota bacterium]